MFSSEFRNDILEHNKESGCKGVIMNNSESIMEIEMDNDNILFDVDTLKDFQRAKEAFAIEWRNEKHSATETGKNIIFENLQT